MSSIGATGECRGRHDRQCRGGRTVAAEPVVAEVVYGNPGNDDGGAGGERSAGVRASAGSAEGALRQLSQDEPATHECGPRNR